jgi:hypothetical protein
MLGLEFEFPVNWQCCTWAAFLEWKANLNDYRNCIRYVDQSGHRIYLRSTNYELVKQGGIFFPKNNKCFQIVAMLVLHLSLTLPHGMCYVHLDNGVRNSRRNGVDYCDEVCIFHGALCLKWDKVLWVWDWHKEKFLQTNYTLSINYIPW